MLFEPRLRYSRLTLNMLHCGDFCSSSVHFYWDYRGTPNPSLCGAEEPVQAACSLAGSHPTHPQFSRLLPEESDCCKPGAPESQTAIGRLHSDQGHGPSRGNVSPGGFILTAMKLRLPTAVY